jgi:predicted DNA-binding transcriptional regulator AlpA
MKATDRPRMTPRMLKVTDAAEYIGLSRSCMLNADKDGQVPAPHRIRNCVRFDRLELDRWIDAGMPSRAEWEKLKCRRSEPDAAPVGAPTQ